VPGDGLEIDAKAPRIGGRVAPRPIDPTRYGDLVTAEPVKVLVLYSHPLMGEGLERMLAAEPGIVVYAVDIAEQAAVDEALAGEPAVIVVEEGGRVDAADVVRRSNCPVVLDVDITTTRAWALHREALNSRPDDFLAAIRAAVNGAVPAQRAGEGRGSGTDRRRATSDKPLAPVITPG
jgi:DNA-binding NarL/FixJ family response regulator